MDQLRFWTDTSANDSPRSRPCLSDLTNKSPHARAAARCLDAARLLQRQFDAKHASATNMLSRPATRKRVGDGDSLRKEALRLERIQLLLQTLAERHETRTISPDLVGYTRRAAIEHGLFTKPATSALRLLFNSLPTTERTELRIQKLVQEALLLKIPGYFPSPAAVANQVMSYSVVPAIYRPVLPGSVEHPGRIPECDWSQFVALNGRVPMIDDPALPVFAGSPQPDCSSMGLLVSDPLCGVSYWQSRYRL
jgi:hypothetical protein